jgi:SAM-dependent methyltransferase
MSVNPPDYLMVRVSGNSEADAYHQVGARAASKFMATIAAHASAPVKDVLDWGCGPGRVAVHIDRSTTRLHGCDVDAEAVAWCNENIEGGFFAVSALYPPLPYADASFDAVLAVSVMTHLNRGDQALWLKELSRVLRPDGLLVASVHGAAAAQAFGVPLPPDIYDGYLNIGLTGVVPDGYYRDVLQTQAYTRKAWAQHFEIIAYEEAGLELHDLVTCRRRPDLPPFPNAGRLRSVNRAC